MNSPEPFNPYEPPREGTGGQNQRVAFAAPFGLGMVALAALAVVIAFFISPADPISMWVAIAGLLMMGAVGFALGRMTVRQKK